MWRYRFCGADRSFLSSKLLSRVQRRFSQYLKNVFRLIRHVLCQGDQEGLKRLVLGLSRGARDQFRIGL